MAGTALQADELGDVLEVLPEDELVPARDNRYVADAVGKQLLFPARIVENVDRDEINFFLRKKLFRSETAASPGLGEENEFFAGGIHDLRL